VVGASTQRVDLLGALGSSHVMLGKYPLRPGVDLILLARRDLVPPKPRQESGRDDDDAKPSLR